MKTTVLASAPMFFAAFSYAADYPSSGTGPGPSDGPITNTTEFRNANRNPDATNNLTLNSFVGIGEWTWEVNVTNVAVSDGEGSDPHVVNTVYDIQWEGGNDLNTTLGNNSQPLCATVISADFPTNVTAAYNSTSYGHCEVAFGETCADSIRSGLKIPATPGQCPDMPIWSSSDLLGCELFDNFAVSVSQFSLSASAQDVADTSVNNTDFPLRSRNGFYYEASPAYSSSNATALAAAKSKLQVMVITGGSSFDTMETGLYCMRVDPELDAADPTKTLSPSSMTGTGHTSSTATTSSAADARSVAAMGAIGLASFGAIFSLL